MANITINGQYKNVYDTAANFTSNNPVLRSGVLAIESDTGNFKVGSGTDAWNSLAYAFFSSTNVITNADINNDISAANATADLANFTTVGTIYRFSWFGGDGSNTFSFVATTATINGIDANEWVGRGTGHLDLLCTGAATYEVKNSGEIWDSGNIPDSPPDNSRTFAKFLNGNMHVDGVYSVDTTGWSVSNTNVGTYGWSYLSTSRIINIGMTLLSTSYEPIVSIRVGNPSSVGSNTKTTTQFNVGIQVATTSSGIASSIAWSILTRWTTSYPRV